MAGKNNGTGQPLSFRCSSCRKKYAYGFRLGGDGKGWSDRTSLTAYAVRAVQTGRGSNYDR